MSVFTGSCAALVTPFDAELKPDFDALGELIERLIRARTDALCVLGTTGEPSTMTDSERREVASFVIERAGGRVPVIVGCGSNSTAHTIELAREAEVLGANALLVITPYYNKCTQGGLVAHYSAVAGAVHTPVIAYNVPSRTGVNLLPSTAAVLAEKGCIAGIKEASGSATQLQELIRLTAGKLDVYLGEDALTYLGMTLGAKGVVSVAANVVPREMHDITEFAREGKFDEARDIQLKLLPLIDALFSEVNPIPVKKAVSLMGIGSPMPRLPLTEMEEAHAAVLTRAMTDLGLIKE